MKASTWVLIRQRPGAHRRDGSIPDVARGLPGYTMIHDSAATARPPEVVAMLPVTTCTSLPRAGALRARARRRRVRSSAQPGQRPLLTRTAGISRRCAAHGSLTCNDSRVCERMRRGFPVVRVPVVVVDQVGPDERPDGAELRTQRTSSRRRGARRAPAASPRTPAVGAVAAELVDPVVVEPGRPRATQGIEAVAGDERQAAGR